VSTHDLATDPGDDVSDEVFRALAEPRRRSILRLVAGDELSAGEIAQSFEVTRTAISQHLTVLKGAGLVQERRNGTRRLYRARPEGLEGLRRFLEDMWASSLDVARRLAEASRGDADEEMVSRAG
jgi:DNA-binding transcriptional ArsR family regulator